MKKIVHAYGLPAVLAVLIALSSSRNYHEKNPISQDAISIQVKNTRNVVANSDILIKVNN